MNTSRCSAENKVALKADHVLERKGSVFFGLGAFISVLKDEIGDDLAHPKHKSRVDEWIKTLEQFPREGIFPCFQEVAPVPVEVSA
ncbi:MAG: hypothetical protein WC827_04575 [Candidatus Paceibacterota bacterium]